MKKVIFSIIFVSGILTGISRAGVKGPYEMDVNTLHLYHLNGDANDTAVLSPINLSIINGATVSAGSYLSLGTALNTYEGTSGVNSHFPAAMTDAPVAVGNFVGPDGAFTFEAVIRPAFERNAIPNAMQIISGDIDGSLRGWHFRIEPSGNLTFIKLTGTQQTLGIATPSTGIHAYAANEWYHVAVTYNGLGNTEGNMKFYWTSLESGVSQAVELASFKANEDMNPSTMVFLGIGNEGRKANGETENFEGLIDEVRISSVARLPSEMLVTAGINRPVIISDPNDLTVKDAQTAVFRAVFTSTSAPSAEWYKTADGSDVYINPATPGATIQLTYDSQTQQYTSVLSLANAALQNAGQYYCKINNLANMSRNTKTARLRVQSLVARWTLDQDDYAGNLYKESVGGYDAQPAGNPVFVPGANGMINGALTVNALNGWANTGPINPLEGITEMTLSFWVFWKEASVSSQNLSMNSTAGADIIVPDGLKANQSWQHISAVFDGQIAKIYVDGLVKAQGEYILPADTTLDLNIGSGAGGANFFNGTMDDVRIYNYAKTPEEIADLYYAISSLPVCLYPLTYDFTGPAGKIDCVVNMYDYAYFTKYGSLGQLAAFASDWLSCGLYPVCN